MYYHEFLCLTVRREPEVLYLPVSRKCMCVKSLELSACVGGKFRRQRAIFPLRSESLSSSSSPHHIGWLVGWLAGWWVGRGLTYMASLADLSIDYYILLLYSIYLFCRWGLACMHGFVFLRLYGAVFFLFSAQ